MSGSPEPAPRANDELDAALTPVAIQRIIEEIRVEKAGSPPRGYNRTYTRHNRS